MRTAADIFLTVGVPIPRASGKGWGTEGFRAFNEHDIKAIQDEAFKAGMSRAAEIATRRRPDSQEAAQIRYEIVTERNELP